MKKFMLVCAAMICGLVMFSSCQEKDSIIAEAGEKPVNKVEFNGVSVENRSGTLVFDNVAQMKEVISKASTLRADVVTAV